MRITSLRRVGNLYWNLRTGLIEDLTDLFAGRLGGLGFLTGLVGLVRFVVFGLLLLITNFDWECCERIWVLKLLNFKWFEDCSAKEVSSVCVPWLLNILPFLKNVLGNDLYCCTFCFWCGTYSIMDEMGKAFSRRC